MTEVNHRSFLRLVHDRDSAGQVAEGSGHFEPIQTSLVTAGQRTLVVCTTDSLDERSFIELITEVHPRYALDFRATPRFDFGSLNRRRVLALFDGLGIHYQDLGLEVHSDEAVLEALMRLSEDQEFVVSANNNQQTTTVLVFIDPRSDYQSLGLKFVQYFRQVTSFDWEVVLNGPIQVATAERRLLFISHANPEDNEFVLWLQAQLTRHGYEVWSDLTTLKAGEPFWDTIEDVIRNRAARMLVVVSQAAMAKPNVLDEISLAVSIERAEQMAGFVIPLRIDLPFIDFRANIARKNAIDYSKNWSRGLIQLVETLKRDRVPRTGGFGQSELESWWTSRRTAQSKVEHKPETLVSNQFNIESLPTKLYMLRGKPSLTEIKISNVSSYELPLVAHQDGWLSFLTDREFMDYGITGLEIQTTALTSEFKSGSVSFMQHLRSFERQRLLHRMLNQQWEWFLSKKGLLIYGTPNRAPVMYFPDGHIEKNRFEFIDIDGATRKRQLVGYSNKRSVYWHLGLTGRFTYENIHAMKLRLSVIFTDDGKQNVVPIERMRELRRRFCKNWWNDKWRGLQSAAMASLSDKKPSIVIHDGESGKFVISSLGRTFISPISIREEIIPSQLLSLEETDYDNLIGGTEESEDSSDGDTEIGMHSEEV